MNKYKKKYKIFIALRPNFVPQNANRYLMKNFKMIGIEITFGICLVLNE